LATDFFESQDAARRNTGRLVILFGLAVIAILITIYALAVGLVGYQGQDQTGAIRVDLDWWDPELMGTVAIGVLLLVGGGSLYKIAQLRGGGRVVAEQLGGRLLHPDSSDPGESVLLNVVEEMALASGTATPPVYLLEDEDGINAFAAGFSPNDAVIAVTRGALDQLRRDELQGVVAHEFSHILNGDMRLNIRLMGVLHGILLIGILGYFVFRSAMFSSIGRRSDRGNSGLMLLALGGGLIVIGSLGTFFGKWIKASVSRQREFLADASAVQFTRDPGGIAGALKRIGGFASGSAVTSPNAPEVSHLFFGQALSGGLNSIMATHPPLAERIRRLDPSFDGEFGTVTPPGVPESAAAGAVSQFAGATDSRVSIEHAVEDVGRPTPQHLAYAAELVRSLPTSISDVVHESYGARALIYALLIDRDPDSRRAQLAWLAEHADPGVGALTLKLLPDVEQLGPRTRLPLVDMALPALRELSLGQYQAFRRNVEELVRADARIDLFEWTLQRILIAHLAPHFEPVRPLGIKYRSMRRLAPHSRVLLSALALASGGADPEGAYKRAANKLGLPELAKLPLEHCGLAKLDGALNELAQATPPLKRQVLQACAEYIASDGRVAVAEAELLRATADALGCPMPPLLPSAARDLELK
jgi:Zn-dependent protease with chaperone function